MYPATIQKISAEHDREMREQAATWRRTQQARNAMRGRPTRIRFGLLARLGPAVRPGAGHKRLHGPAAA